MKNQKITTYQMAVTAVMAAVLCVLGPLTVPIGAIPISLANFVICLTAWLLGPKFGTLSVVIYLAIGLIGVPVFSGYGAGLAKVAGPTGGDAVRPVGTVYLGAARGDTVYVKKLFVSRPDRAMVRARAAQAALELALRLAQGKVPAGTQALAKSAQHDDTALMALDAFFLKAD